MKAQSLKRLERSSPKTGDLIQTTASPLEAVMQDARPFRDKVVLVARNRVQRRTAVGYPATSGSRVSRISLINFSFGFQRSSS